MDRIAPTVYILLAASVLPLRSSALLCHYCVGYEGELPDEAAERLDRSGIEVDEYDCSNEDNVCETDKEFCVKTHMEKNTARGHYFATFYSTCKSDFLKEGNMIDSEYEEEDIPVMDGECYLVASVPFKVRECFCSSPMCNGPTGYQSSSHSPALLLPALILTFSSALSPQFY